MTTGYFTPEAQREIVSDRFPLLLVNGLQVGEAVARNAALSGIDVARYIRAVDAQYDGRVSSRLPSEILSENFFGPEAGRSVAGL